MRNLTKINGNVIRRCPTLIMLLFTFSFAFSQKTVTGVVKDNNGAPLEGATVEVKGTNVSTLSGVGGVFSINMPSGKSILVISFINFDTKEVNVGSQTNVDVTLVQSNTSLNEVIVTGYTTQRKKEVTGAVSVIKPSELTKVASPSFLGQIEGRASGATVLTSGAPGDGASLRIRGNSTLTQGGGDPLIVIDGVQVKGPFMNNINPNDIESIQVLKDAATTASYGIGANNGVVIITTKKGKSGTARIDVSSYVGVQSAAKEYDLIKTSAEYAELLFQAQNNSSVSWAALANNTFLKRLYGNGPTPVIPEYINPVRALATDPPTVPGTYNYPNNLIMKASAGTDWWDVIMRNAVIHEQNIGVSGGNDRGRYFMSLNYFRQDGIVSYTDFKRYSARANTDFKVKNFTFGENMTITFSNGVGMPNGNQVEQNQLNEGLLKMQPIVPVYDIMGNWGGTKAGFGNGKNGLAQLFRNKDNRGENFNFLGNAYMEMKFLKHFTARVNYGINFFSGYGRGFTYIDWESNERLGSNTFRENHNRFRSWIFQQQVSYDNQIGEHSIKATALHEAQLSTFRNIDGRLDGYPIELQALWYLNTAFADPGTRQVNSSGGTNNAKESYLGRVEYGFRGKYLVNLTARYDQSSNFALDKGELFGGVGAAWRVSDEAFLQNVRWINDLKLRAAWGVTGNDAINPNSNYSFFGGGPGTTFYDINGTNTSVVTGYTATSAGEPVKWEKQRQYNVGVDAILFKNQLEMTIEYYRRENKDFLFRPGQPGTFPYTITPPFKNIGEISNNGVEVSAVWKSAISTDFRYDVGVNLTFNKNKIDQLAPELGVTNLFPSTPESRIGNLVRIYEGQPLGTFYGYIQDGIFQTDAEVNNHAAQPSKKVGRFRFRDMNKDGNIDESDKVVIGDPNPDLVFGFNLGMAYKDFDFTMFLQGTAGNDIFNYTKYFTHFFGFSGNRSNKMLYDSWTPTRTDAELPILDVDDNFSFQPSTYYIEDGSYIRCKVLQVGYRLPRSILNKFRIDNFRFYVQAQNLFTITKYTGLDPTLGARSGNQGTEQWQSIDFGNYPTARSFMVGINLGF